MAVKEIFLVIGLVRSLSVALEGTRGTSSGRASDRRHCLPLPVEHPDAQAPFTAEWERAVPGLVLRKTDDLPSRDRSFADAATSVDRTIWPRESVRGKEGSGMVERLRDPYGLRRGREICADPGEKEEGRGLVEVGAPDDRRG